MPHLCISAMNDLPCYAAVPASSSDDSDKGSDRDPLDKADSDGSDDKEDDNRFKDSLDKQGGMKSEKHFNGSETLKNVKNVISLNVIPVGWNFETVGVRICNNGLSRLIRAAFGAFIADAKALAQFCSLRNSSGSNPCPCCKNCLGHCEYFDDAYFVHIHSAEAERFDPHTPETFAESVQMVREAADAVQMGAHPSVLANAEQLHGIVFDAESMAFDEDICKQANLPDSIFFDTMHNVCASGGFAQYEVNQFCRQVAIAQGVVAVHGSSSHV